jgi:hypothetical protein
MGINIAQEKSPMMPILTLRQHIALPPHPEGALDHRERVLSTFRHSVNALRFGEIRVWPMHADLLRRSVLITIEEKSEFQKETWV